MPETPNPQEAKVEEVLKAPPVEQTPSAEQATAKELTEDQKNKLNAILEDPYMQELGRSVVLAARLQDMSLLSIGACTSKYDTETLNLFVRVLMSWLMDENRNVRPYNQGVVIKVLKQDVVRFWENEIVRQRQSEQDTVIPKKIV